MNSNQDLDSSQLDAELQEISANVWALAKKCPGDSRVLLSLLRTLELLHREIREEMFQPSLPDTRKALYQFLKEIEETGGWPYIERMKLQAFLSNLQDTDLTITAPEQLPSESPEN
ncbi:MAG: hypothetical protein AB4426_05235 [Xenococcaceae cyanobacterium]